MNSYKITKAIRFKLEAEGTSIPKIEEDVAALRTEGDTFKIKEFVDNLGEFLDKQIQEYLYCTAKDGDSIELKKHLEIKNIWLKSNAKKEIADLRLIRGFTIKDINNHCKGSRNLEDAINYAFDSTWGIYEKLYSYVNAPLHDQTKRADIGLLLKKLHAKDALPYLISLVENSNDKNEIDDLSLKTKNRATEILKQLTCGLQHYLPEQSSGLSIAKASFNYYTINKQPINFGLVIDGLEKELRVEDLYKLFNNNNKLKHILEQLKNDIQKELQEGQSLWLGDAPMLTSKHTSLRQILKNIKSKQKKQFSENMQRKTSFNDLKGSELYLFNNITEGQFSVYEEYTKTLENNAATLGNPNLSKNDQKTLQSNKKNIAKKRGKYMRDHFETWKSFCVFYRDTAQKHGKILAQLKGIEKERTESNMLKYWALIINSNNQYKLCLIPKEYAKECKDWLKKNQQSYSNGDIICAWFESFTLRSLRKLCFGFVENGTHSNDFYKNLRQEFGEELPTSEAHISEPPTNKKDGYTPQEQALNEKRKIDFYKRVLGCRYAKEVLRLPQTQIKKDIIEKEFDSLDNFQIALEKICYRRFTALPINAIQQLRNMYSAQIFDITSLDLKNQENTGIKKEKYSHQDKNHTKIWKHFWTKENEAIGFDTRLNPEITILYRDPKPSRVKKYGKDSTMNNRYIRPQFTLVTTFSEHSNHQVIETSFMDIKNVKYNKIVDEFNDRLKKDPMEFAIGIDNGEAELSTLGIYLPNFDKNSNEDKLSELKNIE